MTIDNPLGFMLDQLTRASGWNRVSDEIKGEAVGVLVNIMRDEEVPPGTRVQAVNSLMTATKIGIDSVNSMTRMIETRILVDRVEELEKLVRESDPGRSLPPLPDYVLHEVDI